MNNTFKKLASLFFMLLAVGYICAQNYKPTIRFAVIADRTGGEQKGIFEQTLKQAQTLSPDFMISIGDVIEGYTTDMQYLNEMWDEFEGIKSQIKAPFYSVPGNHDCTNDIMVQEWMKRWGYMYKYMYVDGHLFWLLNTEENGDLSAEQIAYFEKSLENFPRDKWVYIFMHRPLWKENRANGYTKLKKALKDRKNVAVFSGHEHYYLKNTVEGIDHYIVATSGGGNSLRSNNLGEFHHFFFVTVTDDGPVVSNVLYDGIISDSIVNEQNEETVSALRSDGWVNVHPVFLETGCEDSVSVNIDAFCNTEAPLKLELLFESSDSLQFANDTIVKEVSKGNNRIVQTLYNPYGLDLVDCSPIFFNLRIQSEKEGVSTDFTKKCLIEKKHICSTRENWVNAYPYYVDEDWDWSGVEDGSFDFSVSQDKKHIIVKYKLTDDVVNSLSTPQEVQDKIFIELISGKTANRYTRLVVAGDCVYTEDYRSTGIKQTEQDGVVTVFIPKARYGIKDSFYFNLGFLDHDDVRNLDPSVIWWRPMLKDTSNPQFGKFYLQ